MHDIQRWHEKRHSLGPVESCWHCGRQRAKCRSKLFRYADRDEAFAEAKRMNEVENYARPRTAYWCPWCEMYHHTTKLRRTRRNAVVKQQRKWMLQRELERRESLGCPRDTNGDGNCGRPTCPNCGKYRRESTLDSAL